MHIAELSIRRPVAVTMFYLTVVLLGAISFSRLAVDLFPDLSFPRLVIWTTYANVSPEEVERFVSEPIEQNVMQVPGIREVHSVSREGVSLVTLEFNWSADMEYAMLNVRERLDNLRFSLPDQAGRPTILKADPNAEPIMSLAVSGRGGLDEVKGLAENVVKRRLEQIDGVAIATVTGGRERQIQVEVDRGVVEALGISLREVQSALSQANQVATGGTINRGRFKWYLRPVGDFQSIDDIGQVVVVRRGDRLVRVSDIAEVSDGWKERDNLTRFDGEEAIGLLIQKEAGSNTSQVSARVREVLDQLREEYTGMNVAIAFDQADFVNDSINNVILTIVVGGILAFLILFFFLHDIRNPINIGLSIPISIMATFTLLYFSGISLNMMSLGGLALGVGLLVDNSIVVLENIFRHREGGEDRFEAAAKGSREVAMAVTASTLTTVSVFLPIVFVEGVAGQLFRDQALTVAFSLLASLAVSLTLLPMLASRFLHLESYIQARLEGDASSRQRSEERAAGRLARQEAARIETGLVVEPGGFRKLLRILGWPFRMLGRLLLWLAVLAGRLLLRLLRAVGGVSISGIRALSALWQAVSRPLFSGFDRFFFRFTGVYHQGLEWALDHRDRVVGLSLLLLAFAVWAGLRLERRLMPQVDQGEFSIDLVMPAGTSLEGTVATASLLEEWLLALPETEHVFMNAGLVRGESAMGRLDTDINTASLRVRLQAHRKRSTDEVVAYLRSREQELLGAEVTFNTGETTFSQILGTSQADLAVKVRGLDLGRLQELSRQVEERLVGVAGLADIHVDFQVGKPEIRLSVDRRVAETYGLGVDDVVGLIAATIKGEVATEFQDFDRKVEVLVREAEADRTTLQQILELGVPVALAGGRGSRVPLRELVDWTFTTGPNEVRRESQNRQITVFAGVQGRRIDQVIPEVTALVRGIELPTGYEAVVGGVNEEMDRSFRSLFMALGLAVLLVYMILAAQFESLLHPFTIMFSVPMALVGCIAALWLSGSGMNIMSLVGTVTLVGIAVNDAIIKIDFINQLRAAGRPLRAAIVEAGHYRFRPILMTTATTVLGLLPMAMGIGAGSELRSPLAVAVIGGLISSTLLTLVVIPVVYSLFEDLRGNRLGDRSTSYVPPAMLGTGEVRL
jgi:HAE1 family hydrophobic/amphiphilic exporter-1